MSTGTNGRDASNAPIQEKPVSILDREILDTFHALTLDQQRVAWGVIRALTEANAKIKEDT